MGFARSFKVKVAFLLGLALLCYGAEATGGGSRVSPAATPVVAPTANVVGYRLAPAATPIGHRLAPVAAPSATVVGHRLTPAATPVAAPVGAPTTTHVGCRLAPTTTPVAAPVASPTTTDTAPVAAPTTAPTAGAVRIGDHLIFDVTKYGRYSDETDDAMMIIRAWDDACASNEPAKLVIPKGTFTAAEVIFEGPCTCPSPIIVEVQGTVFGTTDISDYTSSAWFSFEKVDGLILTGGGTINGQGQAVWKYNDRKRGGKTFLPTSIKFSGVNNSLIEEINLVNSKGFHIGITNSNNITIQNLNITAPHNSPNTDGIHISRSHLIKISNSTIRTGDDCVSIGEGSINVSVIGITCGPGHGISIGSLGKYPTEKDVRGIFVSNCTLTNTTNGARIKTFHESPILQASNITFQNLVMNQVRNPIIIDQNYQSKKKRGPSNVKISDVHFKNIKGTSATNVGVALNCSTLVPCEGIVLMDIDLSYHGESLLSTVLTAACANAKAIFKGIQNSGVCL